MIRQAQRLDLTQLERAIALMVETDLTLRSSAPVPQLALIERALIQLSTLKRR
jgi:DNA polymerase-3 subunit delta